MPGIDLRGVEFTPVSPKLTRVKLIGAVIGGLIWLAVLSVPLVLKLTGVWSELWAWVAWGLPAIVLVWLLVDVVLPVGCRRGALGMPQITSGMPNAASTAVRSKMPDTPMKPAATGPSTSSTPATP